LVDSGKAARVVFMLMITLTISTMFLFILAPEKERPAIQLQTLTQKIVKTIHGRLHRMNIVLCDF